MEALRALSGESKSDGAGCPELATIIPHIRFPLMTSKQLATIVAPTNILPSEDLVGLFCRLATGAPDSKFISTARTSTQRPAYTLYRSGRGQPSPVGEWGYSGAVDAVTVVVDRLVWLHGVGVFPGLSAGISGSISVRRGPSAQSGQCLSEQSFRSLRAADSELATVLFPSPVPLDAHQEYTLVQIVEATTDTTKQFQGSRAASGEICMQDVRFRFCDSMNTANNGTSPYGGQMPALFWSFRRPMRG